MTVSLTFVTLFLSLVTGLQPVELAVDGAVAAVELRLDGRLVGRRTMAPWKFDVDFGPGPVPHRLVAVAKGPNGTEVARDEILINVPRPAAEAKLVLVRDEDHQPRGVRCYWEHAARAAPAKITVTVDGIPLVAEEGTFILPSGDAQEPHVVYATVILEDGEMATAALAYGGGFGDVETTDMTAVMVAGGLRRPREKELERCLTARGGAVDVLAVERPPAVIYLVQDIEAHRVVSSLRERTGDAYSNANRTVFPKRTFGRRGDEARHLAAVALEKKGLRMFPVGPPFALDNHSLVSLARVIPEETLAAPDHLRIDDAVAVAAVRAAAHQRPRVVVLMTGRETTDAVELQSRARVVEYLARLRVPLVVWTVGMVRDAGGYGSSSAPVDRASWLKDEAGRVIDEVHRQWVVWIEGRYLPDEVELTGSKKLSLAGT